MRPSTLTIPNSVPHSQAVIEDEFEQRPTEPSPFPRRFDSPTCAMGVEDITDGARTMVPATEARPTLPQWSPETSTNNAGYSSSIDIPPKILQPDPSPSKSNYPLTPLRHPGWLAASLASPGSRSRTSSRIKKTGRPGTATVIQASRPVSLTLPAKLRRAISLDESVLPSHCARSFLNDGNASPYYSSYSSASPLMGDPSTSGPDFSSPDSTGAAVSAPSNGFADLSADTRHRTKVWHILMELLATEKGYLSDLRVLVLVYLQQLPNHFILSTDEIGTISRNSQQLLDFHEKLATEFAQIEEMLQLSSDDMPFVSSAEVLARSLESAANMFVSSFQSGQFEIYQAYCSGHPEALDLVRRLQGRAEWDAYEQQCATLAAGAIVLEPAKRRRHSTDSWLVTRAGEGRITPRNPTFRLRLMDFLIKPVQRICKYPLLLSQLQQAVATVHPASSPDLTACVGLALGAMQAAAQQVDDARKHRELSTTSRLILSRMEIHPILTHSFLASLGVCILAGSLEVVYHHAVIAPLRAPTKARYCGAFLYPGYIILVKVKRPKAYEARHWFPLKPAEFSDTPDGRALLPFSFRLSNGMHHFELSARCLAEKAVWMDAVTQAQKVSLPQPENLDSVTSLQSNHNESQISLVSDEVTLSAFLADGGLASPDRESFSLDEPSSSGGFVYGGAKSNITRSASIKRRSSIFTLDHSTSVVRRPSLAHRLLVEKTLADVFSDACLRARTQVPPLPDLPNNGSDLRLSGRSKSWGKATSAVLGKTSSVGSLFYRRGAVDGKLPGMGRAGKGDEPPWEDPQSLRRTTTSPDSSPRRPTLEFPTSSISPDRRRGVPAAPSFAFPSSDPHVCELEENGSEEMATPETPTFPLTPEVLSFHDVINMAPTSFGDTNLSGISTSAFPHSSSPMGPPKHTRTKSQTMAQSVKELLFRRRRSLTMEQALYIGAQNSAPTENTTAIANPVPKEQVPPTARDGTAPTILRDQDVLFAEPVANSMFQRGMAYVLRKRTTTFVDALTMPPRGSADGPMGWATDNQPVGQQLLLPPHDYPPRKQADVRAYSLDGPAKLQTRSRVLSTPLRAASSTGRGFM